MRNIWKLAFIVLAACGHKSAPPSADSVNALVDKAKNPKLQFAAREVSIDPNSKHARKLGVLVPADWTTDRAWGFQSDSRDPTAPHGSFASTCAADPCVLGDFQAHINDDLRDRDKLNGAKVQRDDKTPNSRFVVTRDADNRVSIERYWWVGDKPDQVFSCSFVIFGEYLAAQAAFEKACDSAVIE